METTFYNAKLWERRHMTIIILPFNGAFEPKIMQYLHVLKLILATCAYTPLGGAAVAVIHILG